MLFPPEFVSLPFDWNLLLNGEGIAAAAGLTVASAASAHERPEDDERREYRYEDIDLSAVKSHVAELEALNTRTPEQNDDLATLYAVWANALFDDEDGTLDEIDELFGKSEAILQEAPAQGKDTGLQRKLGSIYTAWGRSHSGFDNPETAIGYYLKAVETLKPLDDAGDGEAKYDIAGIKLSLGIAYRELDDLEKAKAFLNEAFLAYRACEKIGDFDTRFYMGAVSVQQGNLFHEMGEPLETTLDAYNRAMRLYVEVIEDQGDTSLERELANVLIDRSMAVYEHWLDRKFESKEEQKKTIDDVLADINRGIGLLEKQYSEGNEIARYDLFYAVALLGKVCCDAENFDEAQKALNRAINEFADLCDEGDEFLFQMALVYADRALVQKLLGNEKLSEQDCLKGSELVGKWAQQSESSDEEIQELKEQFQALLGQLDELSDG